MGNSNTKRSDDSNSSSNCRKKKEFVDQPINYGSLVPQGIYTAPPEYDIEVVRGFILKKKLSPFYKGMEEYFDNPFPGGSSSTNQNVLNESSKGELILNNNNEMIENNNDINSINTSKNKFTRRNSLNENRGRRSRNGSFSSGRIRRNSLHNNNNNGNNNGNKSDIEDSINFSSSVLSPSSVYSSLKVDPEHPIYSKEEFFKYPIECPICFLYYPRNINYTRCCDQPICTECFIQIKRTFQNPEPTCCPFCVQPNFGVTYLSPDSEEYQKQYEILVKAKERHETDSEKLLSQGSTPGRKRRNVISYTDSHIVTSDDIYPGWNLKYEQYQREQQRLEAMRVRNFNAQVNNSAAFALLNAFLQLPSQENNNNRRIRGGSTNIRNLGNDLEEIMLLEAIRRSLADSNNSNEEINNMTTIEEVNNNATINSNENDNTSNLSITNVPEVSTENIINTSSINDNEILNTDNTIDNPSSSNVINVVTNNQNNDNRNDNPEESGYVRHTNNNNNNLDLTNNSVNDNKKPNIIDSTTPHINS